MNYWRLVRDTLVTVARRNWLQLLLKSILGSAKAAGFKLWLVKYISEHLFDELFKPLIEAGVRAGALKVDKIHGALIIKKVNKAKEEQNEEDYRINISRV